MSLGEAVALVAAGAAAGTINTVVGSGSMVSFPVLLAFGYSPVVANVTNTVGLVPGSLSGVVGYRHELEGQRRRIVRFVPVAIVGAMAGAALLLSLPASAFDAIVPAFVALALVLVLLQPRLADRMRARQSRGGGGGPLTVAAVLATSVYGGYFSAAQERAPADGERRFGIGVRPRRGCRVVGSRADGRGGNGGWPAGCEVRPPAIAAGLEDRRGGCRRGGPRAVARLSQMCRGVPAVQ